MNGYITADQVYWNSEGVWVRKRQPSQNEMEYQMRNWYYFNWLCGDHIVEQHIHNMDVVSWFKDDFPESCQGMGGRSDRKSTRLNSSHVAISYAVFCLKKQSSPTAPLPRRSPAAICPPAVPSYSG